MDKQYSIDVHKIIAKAYIFLLTFRMISPLSGGAVLLHGAGNYFDGILHALGLTLALISKRGKLYIGDGNTAPLLKMLFKLVLWFCLSSIIMATYIQIIYGNYAGESAYSGIVGQLIYYLQYVLIVVYNIFVFDVLAKEEIDKVLGASCVFLLILGYYQLLTYLFGGAFSVFGRAIDIFGVLFPEDSMHKLSLTATEGAKAGGVFSVLVFPYLLAKATISDKPMQYYVQILLWIPVVVFMQSTSAYLMVIAVVLYFILFSLRGGTKQWSRFLKFAVTVFLIGIMMLVIMPDNIIRSIFNFEDISYLVFRKINDSQNGSTLLRTAPLIVNWKTFLRFPLLGVGNGLQGYFYTEFFPKQGLSVAGVASLYNNALTTIVNGSLFFPGILSGYGIIGVLLLMAYVKKMIRKFKENEDELGVFGYMFRFAIVAIIVHGFQTEFTGIYFIWFVLSIPFMPTTYDVNMEAKN